MDMPSAMPICSYGGVRRGRRPSFRGVAVGDWSYYRLAAEQGHTDAQYNLGMCYYSGVGVEQDTDEASCWFQLASHGAFSEAN